MVNFNSKIYWENRYKSNGNSGLGSYGDESIFKADYINKLIKDYKIETINDFGCGDSNQISMLYGFKKYTGYDVSNTVLNLCRDKFKDNQNMLFVDSVSQMVNADLTTSLDVTYHIIEDDYFDEYMHNLFKLTNKHVLIYSINSDNNEGLAHHLKNRKFVDWVFNNYKEFKLDHIEPFINKTNGVSFYLFSKI
jgi:hypothetical protein